MEVYGQQNSRNIWETCQHCPNLHFSSVSEFERHLKKKHTLREGTIILCQFGLNGICSTLQFGDLSEDGYRCHVKQYHATNNSAKSDWSFYSSSQNLPAVLNDPNRGKQSSFFKKTWGDDFVEKADIPPSPHLPEINLTHLVSYCKKYIKRYRRHIRLNENVVTSVKPKLPSISESSCTVPSIFFKTLLELNNIETFNNVFPNLQNTENIPQSIRQLQENLSTYLDVIEMKISKQVSLKSDAFFHAMLSHDTIMEQMSRALNIVQRTREDISLTKLNLGTQPIKLVRLATLRKNMEQVYEQLKLMVTVQQTQPMIQLLLSTSDYVAALDLIASTQKVLSTRLTGVHAFRHLSPQLTEMERLIDKMLTTEFQKYASADLNRSLSDISDIPEKDKLTSIISGIIRLNELEFIDSYKSEAVTAIQMTIKQVMIEIMSDRDESGEIVLMSSNADHMTLAYNEGIIFLQQVAPLLLIILKRVSAVSNLILSVSQMDNAMQSDDLLSKEVQIKIEDKLKKMIQSVCDYCNERCSNVVFPKNDKTHVIKNLNQITNISQLIDSFTCEAENVTGYSSNILKLAFRSSSVKYIQALHAEFKSLLMQTLNSELWQVTEISGELQSIVNTICTFNEIPISLEFEEAKKSNSKYLVINNEDYALVKVTIILTKILLEYCKVSKYLPVNVQFILHFLLELVRYFNSQSYQLIMRTEAIQLARLKTITTANLALVSRSLQFLLWFLPYVRSFLQRIASSDISFQGFDIMENDIKNHKLEIEDKIYNIVSDLLGSQLIDWDARPPVPSQTFRKISMYLVKLHKSLSNILPLGQIRSIYKKVHENFKDKMREQLIKKNIVANGSPQHGVVTSELTFYLQTLRTLQVITENELDDNILYDIW